ncbi:hypothetical protein D9611_001276 [Ephemerocybe angulata]|uniref:Uncharacterized protein n=2 Tax=Ephemerocybe angulata TaxID=980116 RepID=A0A8H6M6P2_9AGAR|nr:hypothetical protein D9611_001276 [Tulosesus angulatus]KAF6756815.1 hypothetical protein DFP72DRAFT_892400 [Tulosesus angulatus]
MKLSTSAPSKVLKLVSGTFTSRAEKERRAAQAHNLAAPVNQLFPEILAYIFELASAKIRDTSMDWIALSHTCQLWRNIALDHQPLWSDISFLNLGLTEAMIARSGSMPITVRLRHSDNRTPAWIQAFHKLEHPPIDRIRSLVVVGSFGKRSLEQLSTSWLGQDLHSLENLEVDGSVGFETDVGELCKRLVSSAPPLRRILFKNVMIAKWDVLPKLGANLKSLSLWWNISDGINRGLAPSISELVGYLKLIPLLEYFAVSGLNAGTTNSDLPILTLKNLKTFITLDSVHTQTLLFGAMHIPNVQRIVIRVDDPMQSTVQLDQLVASIRRAWKGKAKDSVFRRLSTGLKPSGSHAYKNYPWVKVCDDTAGCATITFKCMGRGTTFSAVEEIFQKRLGLTKDQTNKCVR